MMCTAVEGYRVTDAKQYRMRNAPEYRGGTAAKRSWLSYGLTPFCITTSCRLSSTKVMLPPTNSWRRCWRQASRKSKESLFGLGTLMVWCFTLDGARCGLCIRFPRRPLTPGPRPPDPNKIPADVRYFGNAFPYIGKPTEISKADLSILPKDTGNSRCA